MSKLDLNRRELLVDLASIGGAMAIPASVTAAFTVDASSHARISANTPVSTVDLTLTINGQEHQLRQLDANTTLLDCLRDQLSYIDHAVYI